MYKPDATGGLAAVPRAGRGRPGVPLPTAGPHRLPATSPSPHRPPDGRAPGTRRRRGGGPRSTRSTPWAIAAPPPDFGGAFDLEFIFTDHGQYPSWGEKIYRVRPAPLHRVHRGPDRVRPHDVKVLRSRAIRGAGRIYLTPHPTPASPRLTLLGQPKTSVCIVSVKIWNDANGGSCSPSGGADARGRRRRPT